MNKYLFKPEYPEKNLSEQSREPTNSALLWCQVQTWDTLVCQKAGVLTTVLTLPPLQFFIEFNNN